MHLDSSNYFVLDFIKFFFALCLGCTPLHWAAIGGNVEACTVLVHAGTKKELLIKDSAGYTPFQLATDKGHRQIAHILVCYQTIMCPMLLIMKFYCLV